MQAWEGTLGAWLESEGEVKRGRWIEVHVGGIVTEWNSQNCEVSQLRFKYWLCDLEQITRPL